MDGISCIWQAFDALDEKKTGRVSTTTLRVLTHNIGTSLGIQDVERGLSELGPDLSFEEYIKYFCGNVSPLFLKAAGIRTVVNVTWLLCEKGLLRRDGAILSAEDVCKLWEMFHVICETDSNGRSCQPVVIDVEEVLLIARQICERACAVVAAADDKTQPTDQLSTDSRHQKTRLEFREFLQVLESTYVRNLDRDVTSAAIDELHQYYVLEKLKKGELTKTGEHIKSWKKRWFVLSTSHLSYFTDRTEKELKGELSLSSITKVEVPAAPADRKNSIKSVTFCVTCDNRTYEIHTTDLKTRHSWHQALLEAVDNVMSEFPLPKKVFLQRQQARNERRAREQEEHQRRLNEETLMQQKFSELVADKLKSDQERRELEARLKSEEELRQADERRLHELEELRQELERLLDFERQAKRDEEIVRALQSRMLDEEMEKREYLEKLRERQEAVLREERHMRDELLLEQQRMATAIEEERQRRQNIELEKQLKEEEGRVMQELLGRERLAKEQLAEASRCRYEELERLKREQEELLDTERLKLQELERSRRQADEQLQVAIEKLQEAEKAKRILEERKKLHELQGVGLRRPVQPKAAPLTSHRGHGAFTDNVFEIHKGLRQKEKETGLSESHTSSKDEGTSEAAPSDPEVHRNDS